ncbi:TonB-dependent receptor [Pedobacter sp. Leaf194]|uniref:SusC/RagA family TonB-linked outer membrane protein n=1 Tax=Pedobacter sp. Leaf194 TaxID=1736297 RepID=UPI0007034DC6|nr:TonB-dependent receptor [Pedobacter sp. Leaf194]KQS36793.1 hypothetical protein ASG14_07085 [Pedobacter sp. Leaf194]
MRKNYYAIASILFLCFCFISDAKAQERSITGQVKDASGETLPGASVLIKNSKNSTLTDADGKFKISVPNGATTLVVSFVGMNSKEVLIGGQTQINVILQSSSQELSDVVVVGYGTAKRSDVTGATASVSNKQLTAVATTDPVQALQGRLAGVEVTSNSGQPGAGTRIRIRGIGTINNSDPLYVVDGFQTSGIGNLSPDDIESMDILKDASATAIYGSRGANGVVLVTTKKGKIGKPEVNFNSYVGVQQVYKKLNLISGAGYAKLITQAYANENQPLDPKFVTPFQNAIQSNAVGTDWQDAVLQNGLMQNYYLSYAGGSENNKYLFSGNYFKQDGTIKNSGFQKYNIRLNDEFKFNNWLKGGVIATYTRSAQDNYNRLVLRNAALIDPITPVTGPDGNYVYSLSEVPNPVRAADEQSGNNTYSNNLLGNLFVSAQIIKSLTFRSEFGVSFNNVQNKNFLPQYYIGSQDQNNTSALTESRSENVSWTLSNYLNYKKVFNKKHSFDAILGQEVQKVRGNGISITAFDVPADVSLRYISAARNTSANVSSSAGENTLLSFFGRLNYAFNDKYLITATLRFDQSSKFLPETRLGTFPSFSFAWRASQEEFLKNWKDLSNLKFRVGYGEVGNQNSADNYGFASVVTNNQNYSFNNVAQPGSIPTQLANTKIKWENTKSTNFGLDADFFDYKLSLTADYFIKKTSDMIALLPVPDYLGFAPPRANVGSMENKGIELSISYKDKIGDFGYNLGANFTKIRNKITSLGGGNPIASGNVLSQLGNTTITKVGSPLASYFGLKTDGIFHSQGEVSNYKTPSGNLIQPNAKPGDVKYVDFNGDGVINGSDNQILGDATSPDFSYGFNGNFTYKQFDLGIFFQGVQGQELVNGLSFALNKSSNFAATWNNFYADRANAWTPANTNTNEPRVTSRDLNKNDQFSDRYVEDGSYLRIKNIQLGYNFSANIMSKLKLNGLRVYAAVDNLATFTKYRGFDPEISSNGYFDNPLAYGVDFGNYPQPRTFRFGINVQL